MSFWPAHSLAQTPPSKIVLKRGAKCAALIDLPGVPAGTTGKVQLAVGFNWPRYRVRFANNVELNGLDGRHLTT